MILSIYTFMFSIYFYVCYICYMSLLIALLIYVICMCKISCMNDKYECYRQLEYLVSKKLGIFMSLKLSLNTGSYQCTQQRFRRSVTCYEPVLYTMQVINLFIEKLEINKNWKYQISAGSYQSMQQRFRRSMTCYEPVFYNGAVNVVWSYPDPLQRFSSSGIGCDQTLDQYCNIIIIISLRMNIIRKKAINIIFLSQLLFQMYVLISRVCRVASSLLSNSLSPPYNRKIKPYE